MAQPETVTPQRAGTPPTAGAGTVGGRLLSLDALRGFDMFWIMGADALGNAVSAVAGKPPEPSGPGQEAPFSLGHTIADQLEHVEWAGFHFEDLIFPMFVFMAGVSQVFSLTKLQEKEGTGAALWRLLKRTLLLYVIGIFYYGGFNGTFDHIRLLGVLQRIALASGGAGALFLLFRTRALVGITAGILLGYWALVALVPVKDISLEKHAISEQIKATPGSTARSLYDETTKTVTGSFDEGKNVVNHFDFNHLPWRKWDGHFDPEGVLSTIPAVASCLLGVLAGIYLRSPGPSPAQKALSIAGVGVVLLAAGWGWHPLFPVIKKIWSSSFVLVAGGWSAIFLGTFYWIIDVRGWKSWCAPFVWVGTNSITVYLAGSIIDFERLASRFAGGQVKVFLDQSVTPGTGTLVLALTGLGLVLVLARFLYRRQIFIRV